MREVREILAARAKWSAEPLVLGTVVDVAGSAYRQPGARMLLRRSGDRVGLISGGCLERDVAKHAFARTENGPQTVLYDTRGDRLDPQGKYGSGCDGLVHLFLERIEPHESNSALQALIGSLEQRQSLVLATLFSATGDFADLVGLKVIADTPGEALNPDIPDELQTALAPVIEEAFQWHRPRTLRLQSGDATAAFLVEPLRPPLDLLIFGAGDDVQPVAQMAHTLGWDLRIADQWPVWTTRQRFPTAREITCAPAEKLLDEVRVDADTHALLMTHDFEADAAILPQLLQRQPAFVGLLGPRRRTMRLVEQLHSRGQLPDPNSLDQVQTPLGLDLGGEAPSEVALSVVGGVLAAYNERSGQFLQSGRVPIHDEHQRMTRQIEEGS